MVYTEVLSTLAVVLIALSIGFQYYLFRFLSVNGEKADMLIDAKIDDVKTYIGESIENLFDDGEELSKEEQAKQEQEQAEQFIQTVTVAMVKAFQTDQLKQVITDIIMPLAPAAVMSPEDAAKIGELEGAAVVNLVSGINPFMPKIIENFMGEDWQDQVAKNPQMFVALLTKLQQSGALSFFESFLGGNGGNGGAANQQQPSNNVKRISGW